MQSSSGPSLAITPYLEKPTGTADFPSSTDKPYEKTFRVRGIPHSCKRSETYKIIKTVIRLQDEDPGLKVCSIAFNPYRESQERVATISFAKVPNTLSGSPGKDE
jgi:hypothetical protein